MFYQIPLFLNLGTPEMILIMFVALLLFGGKKLPELARGLGKGLREFKEASDGLKTEINNQINQVEEAKTELVKTVASEEATTEPVAQAAPEEENAGNNPPEYESPQPYEYHNNEITYENQSSEYENGGTIYEETAHEPEPAQPEPVNTQTSDKKLNT